MANEQRWLVVRCAACQRCSGQRRQGGRCPHCGAALSASSEVVKECNSSASLHLEVALANTPEELREELRRRLTVNDEPSSDRPVSVRAVLKELRDLAESDGSIGIGIVRSHLEKRGIDASPEGFMEQAELEGLVLRLAADRWMFFE